MGAIRTVGSRRAMHEPSAAAALLATWRNATEMSAAELVFPYLKAIADCFVLPFHPYVYRCRQLGDHIVHYRRQAETRTEMRSLDDSSLSNAT